MGHLRTISTSCGAVSVSRDLLGWRTDELKARRVEVNQVESRLTPIEFGNDNLFISNIRLMNDQRPQFPDVNRKLLFPVLTHKITETGYCSIKTYAGSQVAAFRECLYQKILL